MNKGEGTPNPRNVIRTATVQRKQQRSEQFKENIQLKQHPREEQNSTRAIIVRTNCIDPNKRPITYRVRKRDRVQTETEASVWNPEAPSQWNVVGLDPNTCRQEGIASIQALQTGLPIRLFTLEAIPQEGIPTERTGNYPCINTASLHRVGLQGYSIPWKGHN